MIVSNGCPTTSFVILHDQQRPEPHADYSPRADTRREPGERVMRFRSLPIIPRLGHVGPYVPLQLSPHRDRHVDACRLPLSAGFRMGDVSIDGRGGWEGNILNILRGRTSLVSDSD